MLRHRRILRRTVVNRIDRADDPIFGISGARNTTTSAGPDLRKGNIQMMSVRRAAERGQTTTGWLDSRHSFSFGRYRSEEHTSELQSLMRISYAVFCLKKKKWKHSKETQT